MKSAARPLGLRPATNPSSDWVVQVNAARKGKEILMCGRGLTWTYKPTPQPGDYVEALICGKCHGRAKLPRLVSTRVYQTFEHLVVQEARGGGLQYTKTSESILKSATPGPAAKCCGKDDVIKVTGKVVRTVWSKDKQFKSDKNFFIIVKVPELKRYHWATIDTVTLINPLDHLISSIERGTS